MVGSKDIITGRKEGPDTEKMIECGFVLFRESDREGKEVRNFKTPL